jgi:hypothetical protein
MKTIYQDSYGIGESKIAVSRFQWVLETR